MNASVSSSLTLSMFLSLSYVVARITITFLLLTSTPLCDRHHFCFSIH